ACEALHVLVHNAAVYVEAGLLEITPAQWQEVVEIDCNAVFHLTQRALPLLRAAARPEAPA
ncbi:MAG: SDR family oxidoreductase, partial [Gammaproteobacteria bacterium]|nr:SDR family oxidoreductase [Gammaproteobacteria bacterium]NIR97019.1 SDR family oxidoreductase [Gammaproteobacteria bacterium]NIT62713.1 SDR family oxidoreductase [Gammaproteobacteria bacterium]NIV22021.1 SDR family oxidoreductase [Gammaproteobacteria bacterium]NIY31293.1 SDR family oxidoreductase [Gammaproteobacteria bacterium]